MSDIIDELPEFINFREVMETPDKEEIDRVYLRNNSYLAIIGYKKLEDFARFTSSEDLSIDTIEFGGKDRVYFTGLKRRAVYRRASEAILREHSDEYTCATPDHQCMDCYNCYAYGGTNMVKKETKSIRSRMKMTTSYSIQPSMDAIVDEDEFHIMVHRDLEMKQSKEGEQKKGSIHTITLIKPGTVFPFIDMIFNPTKFDLAMYLETIKRGDAEGFGSKGSLLGTMSTKILA
ncbi:MAG: type I-D CRISPR-associated protein Cas7/Csc2, partial [Candidatus Lokiarchaeota archaeon]|nr:type I-D CRISPR-associated protein Cas7/Csc2 [Candidatus Lokiarchaeota archaeon]